MVNDPAVSTGSACSRRSRGCSCSRSPASPHRIVSALRAMAVAGACWGWYSVTGRGSIDPLAETATNFLRATALTVVALAPHAAGDPSHDGRAASRRSLRRPRVGRGLHALVHGAAGVDRVARGRHPAHGARPDGSGRGVAARRSPDRAHSAGRCPRRAGRRPDAVASPNDPRLAGSPVATSG